MNIFIFFITVWATCVILGSYAQKQFPGAYKLFITRDCPRNLDIYRPNLNGKWPAKIINPQFKPSSKNDNVPLDITWQANTTNVKGFKIVLKPTGKPDICRILDYTGTISDYDFDLYSFKFNFKKIYKNLNFIGELYPLPSSDNSSQLVVFNTVDCSMFSPESSFEYDGRNLLANLSKGPTVCNYIYYQIIVYKNVTKVASKIFQTEANEDKLQVNFELNICEGFYYLMFSVYDKHFNDQEKCVCKDRGRLCRTCLNSKTKPAYFIPAESCSPKTITRDWKPNEEGLHLLLLKVFIGMLLITLLLFLIYWKTKVKLMAKKRGIVLFLDDHKYHTDAVFKLVEYLNECHLKVSFASALLKNHDIPDQLVIISEALKCDFILLVLSKALQKRMEAWNKQQDYVEFFKHKNSNILTKPLLEILFGSHKLYLCKFDHVTKFGQWPNSSYSLPTDLTQMTTDLNGQSLRHKIFHCNYTRSNALSKNLQESIEKASLFEQSNKEWFWEKYVCPTNITDSYFMGDEMSNVESVGHSDYVHPEKLKDIFTIYRETFSGFPEPSFIAPSIYSEAVSLDLEQINKRNI